jgi:hypothetical protein
VAAPLAIERSGLGPERSDGSEVEASFARSRQPAEVSGSATPSAEAQDAARQRRTAKAKRGSMLGHGIIWRHIDAPRPERYEGGAVGGERMEGKGSARPPEDDLHGRKLVERVLRDAIKRVVETGVEKIAEGPENFRNFMADLKLPKEIASYLLLQIEETKNGLYRVVAKEIRGFLQQNNLGEEIARALGHLSVEIRTEIRFVPTDGGKEGLGRPEVHSSVQVKSRPDKP